MKWLIAGILVLFCCMPYVLEVAFRVEYTVHTSGVVVITGASTGIGRAAAIDLAERGFTVFAGVRKEKDAHALSKLFADVKSVKTNEQWGDVLPVILDVVDADTIDSVYAEVQTFMKETGAPFVGLVNNAGVSTPSPVEFIDNADARYTFDVNVWGMLDMIKKFSEMLRRSKGRVINISSLNGGVAIPLTGVYGMSKFAMEALSDSFRLEMLSFGVSVSVVEPGYVKTEMSTKSFSKYDAELPAEVDKLYGPLYKANVARYEKRKSSGGIYTTDVTNEAIAHALTSPYPRTRYPVAGTGTFPAWFAWSAQRYLPDRVMDALKMNMH